MYYLYFNSLNLNMIELIVTPDHDSIELAIPESYIGKKVKLSYTIEETEEDAPVIIRKKPSDFKGILRADIVDEFQDYIKKSREEWQQRI